jgi:hypothetical protein
MAYCCPRSRRNPTTPGGYHLRRGMAVLWQNDRGEYVLAYIVNALLGIDQQGRQIAAAQVQFPSGDEVVSPIDRLHELPRHESTARRRGRW